MANKFYYQNSKGKKKNSSLRKRTSKIYTQGKKSSNNYLNYGFFNEYTPAQMKENLFFVFSSGASDPESIKFDTGLVERAENSARQAVQDAYNYCLIVEKGFIQEFSSNFKKDDNVKKAIGNLLQGYGLLEIFNKSGNYTEEEIKKFYNSPLLNFSNQVSGSYTDKSQYIGNADDSDFYYQKIHDMALGLRNAIAKETNRELAYEKLKSKFEEYIKGEQKANVATGSIGLGKLAGELGLNIIGTDLEEQMLNQFLDEVLNVDEHSTANMVESILKKDKNAMNFKSVSQSNQVFGTFEEYFRAYMTPLLLGQIKTVGGDLITITTKATGKDAYNSSTLFQNRANKNTNNQVLAGRTDIKINFNFNEEHKHSYKINISSKLNKGFSQATTEEGKAKSWILKNPSKAKSVQVYKGGSLDSALDRILSSSLLSSGIMSDDDYLDIIYLLINCGQGGLYEKDKNTVIKIYKSISSFCAMDELYKMQGLGNKIYQGQVTVNDLKIDSPLIVNLFVINGQYIPASQYFKAVLNLIDETKKKSYVNTSITFASTFPEANYKTNSFMLGYMDYINDNNLTENNKQKGDPYKISGNIMSNTKVSSFNMSWTQSARKFWSSF